MVHTRWWHLEEALWRRCHEGRSARSMGQLVVSCGGSCWSGTGGTRTGPGGMRALMLGQQQQQRAWAEAAHDVGGPVGDTAVCCGFTRAASCRFEAAVACGSDIDGFRDGAGVSEAPRKLARSCP